MWLLIGGDSEIARAAHRSVTEHGQASAATTRRADRVAPDRPHLDLAKPLDDWAPPPETDAACIFAAIARLADCANDPAGSSHINVMQTLVLIDKLIARGVFVLFLSTNQVFDGQTPQVPPDAPLSPVSEYGRQKARTENELRARMNGGAPIAILRLAKVVSLDMPLIDGWAKALSRGESIRAFDDMMLAPTPTELVVQAIAALMKDRKPGIFQFTGPKDASYAQVGDYTARKLGADPALVTRVTAASAGMPTGATPRNTTMDSTFLRQRHGIAAPEAFDVIDAVLDNLRL
jgi:dTDP-4-dehydrorhamnose reductase